MTGSGIARQEHPASPLGDLTRLAAGLGADIHLWLGDFADLRADLVPDICSAAEVARAQRFASRSDADRYLKSRALLRRLLSAYIDRPADAISIDETPDGKPYVRDAAIGFNLSHSGPHIAIAVRRDESVGVDVQSAKEIDELAIARSLFAGSEIAMLESLARDARRRHFFRIWTCREAVLKAAGLGMKGRGLALRSGSGGTYEVRPLSPQWSAMRLHEFSPGPDSFGALAWPETTLRPQVRQFAF